MTPYRVSAGPLVKRAPKTPWWRLLRAFFWSKAMTGKCLFGAHCYGSREYCMYFVKSSTLWLRMEARMHRRTRIFLRRAKKELWHDLRRLKKEQEQLKLEAVECRHEFWHWQKAREATRHTSHILEKLVEMDRRPK